MNNVFSAEKTQWSTSDGLWRPGQERVNFDGSSIKRHHLGKQQQTNARMLRLGMGNAPQNFSLDRHRF